MTETAIKQEVEVYILKIIKLNDSDAKKIIEECLEGFVKRSPCFVSVENTELNLLSEHSGRDSFNALVKYVILQYLFEVNYYKFPNLQFLLILDFSMAETLRTLNSLFELSLYKSGGMYLIEINRAKCADSDLISVLGEEYELLPGLFCSGLRDYKFLSKANPKTDFYKMDFSALNNENTYSNAVVDFAGYMLKCRVNSFMFPLYAHDINKLRDNALLFNTLKAINGLGYDIYLAVTELNGCCYTVSAIMKKV